MNSKERITAAINHQPSDRVPILDAVWPETLKEWRKQGFPQDKSPENYFGYDVVKMFLDCSPRFEQEIIEDQTEGIIFKDRYGYTAFRAHEKPTLHFQEHCNIDKKTWSSIRSRWTFNVKDSEARIDDRSYFMHFDPYPSWEEAIIKYNSLRKSDKYLLMANYGPWEATWRHRGYENLLMDLALDPEWVIDMAGSHQKMTLAVLRHCLDIGIKPDGYIIIDDLAANRGLLFSPETWREIFKPFYRELGEFLHNHNINYWMHCCGNPEIIFEDLIECGLQVINPLQASTGLHVVDLQEKYKGRLTFCGNINVQKMNGPLDELKTEITTKLSVAKNGGYIYHSDHSVPSDVSFERYQWMINFIKNLV